MKRRPSREAAQVYKQPEGIFFGRHQSSVGASLRDAMEQMSMTPASLAVGLDMTVQSLDRIFNGEEAISPETAARLEMVMDIPARFWNSLQTHYTDSN